MRKIIQKRISMKAQIQTILQNISLKEEKYEKNMVFEPKFHYIEKEVEDNGMEEENEEEGM